MDLVIEHQTMPIKFDAPDNIMQAEALKLLPGLYASCDKELEPYFCESSGTYYVRVGEEYLSKTKEMFETAVRGSALGSLTKTKKGANTVLQDYLQHVENSRRVFLALSLAGTKSGLLPGLPSNRRVLVTSTPEYLKPEKGNWGTIRRFVELFMPDDQMDYFMSWHAQAFRSTYDYKWTPSKLLVLCGGAGSGKTLWQTQVLSRIWGGAANPYRYFIGRTTFNGQFSKTLHLQMSDVGAKGSWKERIDFGAKIKSWVSDRNKEVHGKGEEELFVPMIHRMTLSTNFDSDAISVLPPLNMDGMGDKVMLFKCGKAALPANFGLNELDEQGMESAIISEVPAFLHYMLHEYQVPERCRLPRGGIFPYQNTEVLELIESLGQATSLLDMIDAIFFYGSGREDIQQIEMEAAELHAKIMENPNYRNQFSKIAWDSKKLGQLLGDIEKQKTAGKAGRVSSRTAHGGAKAWRITRR